MGATPSSYLQGSAHLAPMCSPTTTLLLNSSKALTVSGTFLGLREAEGSHLILGEESGTLPKSQEAVLG